ncbi:MAG: YidC/Oxa1 family membrane protein insertase [Clostridia bacterium]|nr:YidC/Oxa1 family membrane protein insertase [Clostridia bacterium]
MFQFFANIFGYLLVLLYNGVNNYGLAIILFAIVIKILLLPLSIKQQKTMKKSAEMQEKMKVIQFKYKNDQEKMNKEMMEMYKKENMSPFSGCLTAIIQILLLISVLYMVRSPLTYMQKIPSDSISKYVQQLKEEEKTISEAYPEIDIIREKEFLKEKNKDDENIEKLNLEMNLFGLDLSKIPQQNMADYKVYIIPILYIISSFISIRLSTAMTEKMQKEKKKEETIDEKEKEDEEVQAEKQGENEIDTAMQTNKMMSWMMPILSISIAFVAPLGLALYWLMSNILMIIERILLEKLIKA